MVTPLRGRVLAFVLAHPPLLLLQDAAAYLPLLDPRTAPWRARLGAVALAALLLAAALSVWRRRLRLSNEAWGVVHGPLAVIAVLGSAAHMVGVGRFTAGAGGRLVVALAVAGVLGSIAWSRVLEPRLHMLRPWRVARVIPERGGAATLVLRPEAHEGWSFMPGQFAWLSLVGSPFRLRDQHPFSLSSPGDQEADGDVSMTIEALGDWSRAACSVQPGARVYVDGPFGSFSMVLDQAPGSRICDGRRGSRDHAAVQHGLHDVRARGRPARGPLLREPGLGGDHVPRPARRAAHLHAEPGDRARPRAAARRLGRRAGPRHGRAPAPAPAPPVPVVRVLPLRLRADLGSLAFAVCHS